MNEDEVKCIVAISTTVKQVAQAINVKYQQVGDTSRQYPVIEYVTVGENNSDVTLQECAEFIDLVRSMVEQSGDDYERIQAILFNTDPAFIPTLSLILQFPPAAPSSSSAGDQQLSAFEQLQVAVLQCLKQSVTSCCVDLYRSPRRTRQGDSYPSPAVNSPTAHRLSNLCGGMLTRCNLPELLVDCLSPNWPSTTIRQFAAELMFGCVLRVNSFKDVISGAKDGSNPNNNNRAPYLELLVDAVMEESNTQIRSFTVAAIREMCGTQPLLVGGSKATIEMLIRLSVMDPEEDVRSMSAESLDVIFRNEPQLWQLCSFKKEIATAVVGRLEDEDSGDVLLSVLRLTETLLIADAALALGRGPNKNKQQQQATASPNSFTETFLNLNGDQHLIACIRGTDEADAFCARCLRLLVEFAPYYRSVAYGIFQHYPSLAKMLRTCVSLAMDQSGLQSVSDMRFELSLAVSIMLCQDPRARELLVAELAKYPMWMGQLRGALLANLNSSSLSDFSGIRVIDVMGDNLSDVRNVEWDNFSQPTRPSRDSLEAFMEDQCHRWIEFADNNYVMPGRSRRGDGYVHDIPEPDPRGEAPETRLTFILITNTVHNSLNASTLAKRLKIRADISKRILKEDKGSATSSPLFKLLGGGSEGGSQLEEEQQEQQNRGGSPHRSESHHNVSGGGGMPHEDALESIVLGTDGTGYGDEYVYGGGADENRTNGFRQREAYIKGPTPAPTRTSLIREWKAHPEKFNAIKNAAKQQRMAAAENAGEEWGGTSAADVSGRPANFFGRGGAAQNTSTYREENFERIKAYTDPYRQPTDRSFKGKSDNHTSMGSMIKQDGGGGAMDTPVQPKPYSKFDAALKLCKDLGEHFRDADAVEEEESMATAPQTHFQTAGSGFVKRMAPGWDKSGLSASKSNKAASKTWTTEHLREGDLFYFSVPFETMTAFAVDQVRLQAICHLNRLKKSYLVTPHTMKGRRWFIFDMTTHVLPKTISVLKDILELIEVHGEENVRFPMLVFNETEGGTSTTRRNNNKKAIVSAFNTTAGGGGASTMDTTLHSGNLLESLDQIRFYFSKVGETNPIASTNSAMMNTTGGVKIASPNTGGSSSTMAAAASTSQYLIDLENKIRALKTRDFSPRHDAKHSAAYYNDVPESDSSLENSPTRSGGGYVSGTTNYSRRHGASSSSPAPNNNNSNNAAASPRARQQEDEEILHVAPTGTAGRALSQNPYY